MATTKLYGSDLIDYVRANPGLPERELAIGAGYCSEVVEEDGSTRLQVHTKPFYQELSMATGLVAPKSVGKKSGGRRGKGLSYNLKTNHNSGNTVVTGGYLEQIGVKPGERVSVEVIEEAGEIVLKRAENQEDPDAVPAADAALAAAL